MSRRGFELSILNKAMNGLVSSEIDIEGIISAAEEQLHLASMIFWEMVSEKEKCSNMKICQTTVTSQSTSDRIQMILLF